MGATTYNSSMGNWESSDVNWDKICCSNPKGPYVQPPKDTTDEDLQKIDQQIGRMDLLIPVIYNKIFYSTCDRSCHNY